jgi:hypothetical protein
MHHKLRNNLISLGAAFALVVGGSFFSEPLPPTGMVAAAPAVNISPEARIAIALLGATMSIAHASAEIEAAENDAADEAKAERPAPPSRPAIKARHKRPALGMPYFSFASFLPRAPQES